MLNVEPLNQQDPKWGLKKLGYGVGTIKNYGCLLVSYTMLLNYFEIKNNPNTVNDKMKSAAGYSGVTKNLWVWTIAELLYNTKYEGSFGWDNAKVLEWIAKGVPVIIKVDGKPIGGLSHYVLAIGGGKICDPFTGKIENFSKYQPLGYHIYTYKGEPMNNELKECFERERIHLKMHNELVDKCNKMEKEAKTLVGQAEELKNTISKQATELTKLKKENKSLDSKLEDTGDKLINAESLREKWLGLYKQSQSNFDSCKIDLTNCKTKVTNLEKEEIPDNKYLKKLYYLVKEWDKVITKMKNKA